MLYGRMPTSEQDDYKRRVSEANTDLDQALREVERALRELTADSPRAEKTIITEVLRVAFEKVASARARLALVVSDGA